MAGFGLRIAKSQGMEGFTGNTNNFPIAADAAAMFRGDPVVIDAATGGVIPATVGATAILGVFLGWEDYGVKAPYGNKGQPFNRIWEAGTDANTPMAKVATPPHAMFWIRGADVAFTQAGSVGRAHPFDFTTPGNTQYGDSRTVLGAPGAGPCIVHRLVEEPGNEWGNAPLLEVSVNLQTGTFADAS